jgi:L-amino acid N-acyltransferase YncA
MFLSCKTLAAILTDNLTRQLYDSKKIMDKLGFQHEGTMKECEIKNGKFINLDIYAKIKAG